MTVSLLAAMSENARCPIYYASRNQQPGALVIQPRVRQLSWPFQKRCLPKLGETSGLQWLNKKRIGTQMMGEIYITHGIRRGEDDDAEPGKSRLASNPFQDGETVGARHVDVQENERREWVLNSVAEN